MSFSSDIKQAVRDQLAELSEDINDSSAADLIYDTERNLGSEALAKAVEPALALNERKAERLSTERYEELVQELGTIIAEAIAFDNLKDQRLLRNISAELEGDLTRSMNKFKDMCAEYEDMDDRGSSRRGKRRDKEQDRETSRRDRQKRNRRGDKEQRKGGRHVNSYERDEDPEQNRDNEEREERPAREERVVRETKVHDGDEIGKSNYAALPDHCKDLPFYYAGLENLVFRDEPPRVTVNVLDGDFKVHYDKHRTDTYLSNNRDTVSAASTLDHLDKQLKDAAQNKVEAYIAQQATAGDDTSQELTINKINLTKSCVVSGVYNIMTGIFQSESAVRDILVDSFGDKFNQQVTGVTFSHLIYKADATTQATKDWEELRVLANSLAIDTKLPDVKALLELTQKFFDPQAYNDLYQVVNAAICNALSCSLKLGIRTNSVLNDWAGIEKLIQDQYVAKPHIIGMINTNLAAGLPSLIFGDDGEVTMLRNFIFLPVSKNEFTVASPIRYATINKSVRPELYGFIQKLLTTNIPPETYKALTTLVTLENESLTVCTNRDLISDSGFYVFQPIGTNK
jgi:hypothetical protein